jgi:hypothetical protein
MGQKKATDQKPRFVSHFVLTFYGEYIIMSLHFKKEKKYERDLGVNYQNVAS